MPLFGPRRRPFRRRPLGRPGPLAPGAARRGRRAWEHARRLVSQGEYQEAAGILESLGQRAEDRSLPFAPRLWLEAGQARLAAGQVERGMEALRRGLRLLGRRPNLRPLAAAVARVIGRLEAEGYAAEAIAIREEFGPLVASVTPLERSQQKVRLPAKCPYCGADARPDEVEWIDERVAACAYCGSVLPSEGLS